MLSDEQKLIDAIPLLKGRALRKCLEEYTWNYFGQNPTLDSSQKKILRQHLGAITVQAALNSCEEAWPVDTEEAKRFITELKEIIVHVETSFQLPPYKGGSAQAKALLELIFEGKSHQKVPFFVFARTLLGKEKEHLLEELRAYFKLVFNALFIYTSELKTANDRLWTESFIGHMLSYYTFFNPTSCDELQIPLFDAGDWQKITYRLEKIVLTPVWMGSSVVAFGLNSNNGPPILLFKGTSYPTDEGFCLQILADINPAASVGRYLFEIGKQKLATWLEKEVKVSGKKARVYGVSLGGALTEHAVISFPVLIDSAYAYNPPALLAYELKRWNQLFNQQPEKMPTVHIFRNENDIVSYAGSSVGQGWKIYQLIGNKRSFFLLAHIQSFFPHKEHLLLRVKSHAHPFWHYLITLIHLVVSVPLFLMGVIFYFLLQLIWRACSLLLQLYSKLRGSHATIAL